MKIWLAALVLGASVFGCKPIEPATDSFINDAHLDHLYEGSTIDGQKIGSIWIYCEAPDYHLVTDDDEGFTCVDDVARSLVFYAKQQAITPSGKFETKIHELTRFVLNMQAENGVFYNFVFPDKQINTTHKNSVAEPNWWSWRAFWALSEVAKLKDDNFDDLRVEAVIAMERVLPSLLEICSNLGGPTEKEGITTPACASIVGGDQIALMMIGLSNYYELKPTEEVRSKLLDFGKILESLQLGNEETFPFYASMSWQNIWHAWGNSQAYALLLVGKQLDNNSLIQAGKREVDFFIPYFLEHRPSFFRLSKNAETYEVVETSQFPQIAYNLRPMIYATLEAYSISKDERYKVQAITLGSWFSGANQANQAMYDPMSGRTFDGIIPGGEINQNSGAESNIEAILSLQSLAKYPEVWMEVKKTFGQ